ncbi:MAG TPA: hypothetical protein VFG68_09525 [Fimbriiglobus sp.]|nr:hypothetical protein [Fimbriiglobus sp.]
MPAAWKQFVVITALVALAARSNAADPPPVVLPLTQFEVLGLVQQGIGDDAVIARLRETKSTFKLSAGDMQMLKALGVSSRVLTAMTGDAPRPLPSVVPAAAIVPAPTALAGSWVRELDGTQVVLKFTDKRLFATLNVAYAVDGKPDVVRMAFRADADYAVGPDGTVFGVVTGTDFVPPKGDAATGAMKALASLNGMPFCFRFRIDEGVLNVRDLRATVPDEWTNSAAVLGRYKRIEKEPAPPKPGRKPTVYSADPVIRMDQLMNQSECFGPTGEMAPAPRPVTPERLHGGIIK